MSGKLKFDDWITKLTEEVIEGEYGYEPGEFTVYPEHWRSMWCEGLTPAAAFKRAVDACNDALWEKEAARQQNWARIQAEDAAGRSALNPDGDTDA